MDASLPTTLKANFTCFEIDRPRYVETEKKVKASLGLYHACRFENDKQPMITDQYVRRLKY